VPRGAAHAWAALGHLREAELRLEEQARTTPQGALQGLCRRSPPAGDRWHIRQPVPAARFTAVLPRGSRGDTEKPAGTGRGTGTQRKDRCPGGPATSGWSPGTGVRSGRWRCRSGTRSLTVCDPSASLPRPAPSRSERAWPFAYPARASVGLPEPALVVHRAFVKGKLGALVPSGPLTVGRWFAQGRRGPGRAAGWQPGCATSLCRDVFGRGQACSYEPGLQAGDGAVL
jgi:hypothetical protein